MRIRWEIRHWKEEREKEGSRLKLDGKRVIGSDYMTVATSDRLIIWVYATEITETNI